MFINYVKLLKAKIKGLTTSKGKKFKYLPQYFEQGLKKVIKL